MSHSLFVTCGLVAAFIFGMYFEKSREDEAVKNISTPRVYLEQLKTKMNIRREGSVDIYLDGTKIQDDVVLDVKK